MAANIYNPVPVPVGDGTGAPVSIIGQGLKTFVIGGTFDATVIVEIGIGGRFAPLYILDKPNQFRNVPVVAEDIRVRVVNHRSGQATVFVGGAPTPNTFGSLAVPAANGTGAALDTALFGPEKTLVVGGLFDATLTFEVSEDAAGPFSPIAKVDKTNNFVNISIIARFIRVVVSNYASGVPSAGVGGADFGGGGGASSASNCLIYQQGGGLAGPVIFDDWDTLYDRLQTLRVESNGGGCYDVVIDTSQSVATPIPGECSVAASATIYDLEDVRLLGVLGAGGVLHFDDGAHVVNMRFISNFLQVDNFNVTTALETLTAGAPALFYIEEGCTLQSVNGSLVGVYDLTLLPFALVRIQGASRLSFFRTGTVFANVAVGNTIAFQIFDANPVQNPLGQNNTISGAVGSTMFLQMENTQAWRNAGTLFLGTIIPPQITEPAFLTPQPFQLPPAVAPIAVPLFGQHLYLDATAGAIAQPLPSMSATAFPFPGGFMAVSDSGSGPTQVTAVAGAGDTINGVASFAIPVGGAVLLAGDGISNWKVIGIFDPTAVSGAVNSRAFIFQPGGGGAGPAVFATWAGLDFALQAARATGGPAPGGLFEVQIDDSIVTPAVIPARVAAYDLTNTELVGQDQLGAFGANTRLDLAAGAFFIGMRRFRHNLGVVGLNTAVEGPADVTIAGSFTISLEDNCFVNTPVATGVPIWSAVGGVAGDLAIIEVDKSSFINFNFGGGLSNGPVVDFPVAGVSVVVQAREGAGVPFVGISGIVGVSLFTIAASIRNIPNVNTGFLGTVVNPASPQIPPSLGPNPFYVAAPNVAAIAVGGVRPGGWYRFDVSGGPIAQPIPAVSSFGNNYKQPGVFVAFTEETGSVGLTLVPAAGDTINGLATPLVVPPGGSIMLVNNGISDSRVIGFYNPLPASFMLQWGVTNVASAADTRYIAQGFSSRTTPTTPDASFRATRAMTLSNFRVRHNAAVGNGAAVVYDILINTVPSGLGLSLVTNAIGDASDLVTTIAVAVGDLIELTATKAASIGNGGQDVTFVCEAT